MNADIARFVTAIDHVGIAVPDLDVAIAFYRDNFGLEVAHEEVNEEQGVREAMLHAPGDHAGTAIQLPAFGGEAQRRGGPDRPRAELRG